jgi:hypothetical protein
LLVHSAASAIISREVDGNRLLAKNARKAEGFAVARQRGEIRRRLAQLRRGDGVALDTRRIRFPELLGIVYVRFHLLRSQLRHAARPKDEPKTAKPKLKDKYMDSIQTDLIIEVPEGGVRDLIIKVD